MKRGHQIKMRIFRCKLQNGKIVEIKAPSKGSLRRISIQKYGSMIENLNEVEEITDACGEDLSKI